MPSAVSVFISLSLLVFSGAHDAPCWFHPRRLARPLPGVSGLHRSKFLASEPKPGEGHSVDGSRQGKQGAHPAEARETKER
jgi:hypothetical protein